MNRNRAQDSRGILLTHGLIILLAFSIPISTAVTSICLYSILLLWLFDKSFATRWTYFLNYPLTKPILLLIGVSCVGMLYTPVDMKTAYGSVYHSIRLAFIPILAFYLQNDHNKLKQRVLIAFFAALILTITCAFIKVYGNFNIGSRTYGNDIFKDHIAVSYLMASALLILWVSYQKQHKFMIVPAFALILFYLLFLNTGKIGFIILCSSFMVYAWHHYGIKGVLQIAALFTILLIFTYHFSEPFSGRLDKMIEEYYLYMQNSSPTSLEHESSFGRRMEFMMNSVKLFWQSPWYGLGTGSYAATYREQFAGSFEVMTNNPHNQYLLIAVQSGIIGLAALLWFFFQQWRMTLHQTATNQIIGQSLLLSFYIGCLFNSWIMDFTEFHFYCLMSALFFANMSPVYLTPNRPICNLVSNNVESSST